MTRFVDWFFRDCRTGRIVLAQWPNLPLWLFAAASVVAWLLADAGDGGLDRVGRGAGVAALLCLLWWSLDEIVRGVNPWRRSLGTLVLVAVLLRVPSLI